MSLLEYLRLLIARGWIVALCALAAAGAMVVYSQRQSTVYRSSMQVIFEPAAANQGTGAAMNSLLRSYVVRVYTADVAAEIVSELGMGISPQALKAGTEISVVPDQSLIRVEVNDTDGDWANVVTLAWGQKLIDQRNELNSELPGTEQIVATIQDFPRYSLYRPRTVTNALLGAVAGVLFGAILVFVIESRSHRVVKSRHDLAQLALLASVPRETL
ncbi:MAG: hypothetical protein KA401_03895 [Anaerolineae bacterium]|nr:hypothetical protein [Anaerolineae bacterium]